MDGSSHPFLIMDNICHEAPATLNKHGIDIHFSYIDSAGAKRFLKTWWDWQGVIPQKGDVILLHWGDNSEETDAWIVIGRVISGTEEKTINVILGKEC